MRYIKICVGDYIYLKEDYLTLRNKKLIWMVLEETTVKSHRYLRVLPISIKFMTYYNSQAGVFLPEYMLHRIGNPKENEVLSLLFD